jgi:hypothetical protein
MSGLVVDDWLEDDWLLELQHSMAMEQQARQLTMRRGGAWGCVR